MSDDILNMLRVGGLQKPSSDRVIEHIEALREDNATLRAKLFEAHELLHKVTAIIPGNDGAGKEVARLLARNRAERSWC